MTSWNSKEKKFHPSEPQLWSFHRANDKKGETSFEKASTSLQ
jgi:hypothetical protein